MAERHEERDRFDWLVQRYLDATITPEEMSTLNNLMRDDASLRARLADTAMQAQLMHEALAPDLVDDPALRFEPPVSRVQQRWMTLVMAAAVAIAASVATWFVAGHGNGTAPGNVARDVVAPMPAAVLTDADRTIWDLDDTQRTPTIGDELVGSLRLRSGTAQLMTQTGAVLTLMGPVDVDVIEAGRCELNHGRIVVYCPERAHGFKVRTPGLTVTDVGTEFGVYVDDAGRSEVHVFTGAVDVSMHGAASAQRVPQGRAVGDGDALVDLPLDPWGFDRAVPLDVDTLTVPAAYTDAISTLAPAAYWRFERNAPLANTVAGGPPLTWTSPGAASTIDGSLRFAADNVAEHGYLYADGVFAPPHDAPLPRAIDSNVTRGDYTLEMWVRPTRAGQMTLTSLLLPDANARGDWQHLSLIELQGKATGQIKPNADPSAIRFLHRDPPGPSGGTDVFSGAPYHIDRWNHVVGVRRGEIMELYLNGGRVWSVQIDDGPVDLSPFRVLVGRAHPIDKPYRDVFGRIDELAIYPHALSDEQIKHHYRLIAGASADVR